MIFYILIFLSIIILYYQTPGWQGKNKKVLRLIFIFLALFVGLSDMLGGYDRYIYGALFDNLADCRVSDRSIFDSIIYDKYRKEFGYVFVNYAFSLITSNRYIFILLLTIGVYYFIYKAIATESNNYLFATILFLGTFFFFTFTYLRQVMGVAVLWYSYRFIRNRKLWKFLVCLAIAVSFHNSLIIFFPAYWFGHRMLPRNWALIICFIALGLGLSGIPSTLFDIYGSATDSAGRANTYINDTSGFRFIYVVEVIVFLFYIFTNYDNLLRSKGNFFFFNCAICFCCILLIFCKSENGGRLSWPFLLGLICCLSNNTSFYKTTARTISLIVLCFVLYARILFGWGILLSPYKTFLEDGVRYDDYIHKKYEYDHNYDYNKFYR
ncbi:MAG: EpsG family protein [Muribaculaceae bacterium]|nr:EpsG family protein [Muribaculaceae bacterium]